MSPPDNTSVVQSASQPAAAPMMPSAAAAAAAAAAANNGNGINVSGHSSDGGGTATTAASTSATTAEYTTSRSSTQQAGSGPAVGAGGSGNGSGVSSGRSASAGPLSSPSLSGQGLSLSRQPSQTTKRGPHDYSASWKIGTTDQSALSATLAAVESAAAEDADANPSRSSGQIGGGGGGGLTKVASLSSLSQRQLSMGGGSSEKRKSYSNRTEQTVQTAAGGSGSSGGPASDVVAPQQPPPRPATTSPPPTAQSFQSKYQDRLFNQPSDSVEAVLAASCDVMGFDIAEMWLRTGPKTHQLTNSHLRPTALEDSVRAELVNVYYGEMASRRTHRLSPALCKRAKEAQDVVWVTANTERGAEALRCSISDVRTAVAVPVCHESSCTNITLIYFSIRRAMMRPQAVEFLVHMSLSAAVSSVNSLAEDVMVDTPRQVGAAHPHSHSASAHVRSEASLPIYHQQQNHHQNHQQRPGVGVGAGAAPQMHNRSQQQLLYHHQQQQQQQQLYHGGRTSASPPLLPLPGTQKKGFSVTGACLDLKWNALKNVEYLTDGGNNWIHTAVMSGRPVVVKTLKPECQDLALAINEIEGELEIHSKLDHPNIVGLLGAGATSKGSRFVVLERLDGGTLTQHLGYDTRIRDRRRRFWKKKQFSYMEVLSCAKSVADAMAYCHGQALPGSMVLHRDLKPDNIGFTLDGTVKLIDFGLARVVENASPESDEIYEMSGETGSLRYMAPEVADCRPYNHKADVYSFGTILWEIVAYKKPYDGMNREQFYEQVVHGGMRPPLSKKWPKELSQLISECWDVNYNVRPSFAQISERLEEMRLNEKGGGKRSSARKRISSLVDRHSTWF